MKQAIKLAEKHLKSLVPYINTNFTLTNSKWALVGGYVRDTIISSILGKIIKSPDIDIAVLGQIPNFIISDELMEINKNTFGGLKVNTVKFGYIDIWSLKDESNFEGEEIKWVEYLRKIDFSINSIIFTYPEQKLYIHDDWLNSFNKRLILQLHESSPYPELQLIRAVALAKNLSIKTGYYFKTSDSILDRLRELLHLEDNTVYYKLIDYAVDKIIKNRWPDNVLREIIDVKLAEEFV